MLTKVQELLLRHLDYIAQRFWHCKHAGRMVLRFTFTPGSCKFFGQNDPRRKFGGKQLLPLFLSDLFDRWLRHSILMIPCEIRTFSCASKKNKQFFKIPDETKNAKMCMFLLSVMFKHVFSFVRNQ